MAQSLPPYPPFECQSEGKGIRWTKWITRLTNNAFVGSNITDDARKKALMLTYAGEDLNDIFDTLSTELVTPQPGTDETVFSKAVEALDVYFNPKQNKEFQRYVFRHTNQERFESVEKFYMRLMQLAATCNFTETSSEIKSQLIAGSINDKITRNGLSEPDLSLDKLLQFAKTLELTDSQNKAVRGTSQTTTVNHVNDSRQRGKQPPNRPKQKRVPHDGRSCFNCGAKWPHEGGQTQCPARGSRCSICHKTNHFAKCCKSNDSGNPVHAPAHRSTKRRDQHINHVQTDKDFEYVYTLSDARPEAKLPHTSVKVENAHLTMMLDTGSRPKLQSVNVKIMAYGSSKCIPHLGRFEATFASKHRNSYCIDTVYVVRGNHGCLLRYSTALQLGLVEMINQVCDDEISQRYPSLVDGRVGDLKDYGPHPIVLPKLHRTYRATQHSPTCNAPATALFGREMKTKLPQTISHP